MRQQVHDIVLLAVLFAAATACASQPAGDLGSLAMAPLVDPEEGLQILLPAGHARVNPGVYTCPSLSGRAYPYIVAQQAFTITVEQLGQLYGQIGLTTTPSPVGTIHGHGLVWQRYQSTSEARILGETSLDPTTSMRLDFAVASQAKTYWVCLITVGDEYATNPQGYDAAFTHMVQALQPLP